MPSILPSIESEWQNTALLVMDMQKDFISRLKAGEAIVPNVIKAVEVARSRSIPIIWIVHEHDPFGRDAELIRRKLDGDGQPKPACKGIEGAEIVDGLVIKGVQTPFCIRQTLFDAVYRWIITKLRS